MSMKEEFDQASVKTGLRGDEDDKVSESYIKELHENVPHVHTYMEYADRLIDRQLTRSFRKFNGTEFEDNEDAIAKTKPTMKLAWLATIWQSLAAGVLVGEQDERFTDPQSVFTDDFELAAVRYANEAAQDEGLMAETSEGFEHMVTDVADNTGFTMLGKGQALVVEMGPDGNNSPVDPSTMKHLSWKVFDLWMMVFKAGAHAYFATGYEIGKARHEEAVLNGIVEASKEEEGGQ